MAEINGIQLPFVPAGGVGSLKTKPNPLENKATGKFGNILADELNKIKFSAHAETRIKSRGIEMNSSDMKRLEGAFESAKAKGSKDSFVMMDNKAFIINVPNKTVITAMDKSSLQSNVITKIDSAVIA
jgi:flagellar operon protein